MIVVSRYNMYGRLMRLSWLRSYVIVTRKKTQDDFIIQDTSITSNRYPCLFAVLGQSSGCLTELVEIVGADLGGDGDKMMMILILDRDPL